MSAYIAKTPQPPYYAVIFTSVIKTVDAEFEKMGGTLEEMVRTQPGFLGMESLYSEFGITVSFWDSLESVRNWKNVAIHLEAQDKGKKTWYDCYKIRICKVERDYEFNI
jgi:heme-degrading monooxygenase HmoA